VIVKQPIRVLKSRANPSSVRTGVDIYDADTN